jgi:hypothetical protein
MFVTRKKICRQTVLDSDADFYGMRLMLRAMTRYKRFTPMTYCGPELFFSSLEIVQSARNILLNDRIHNELRTTESHPPADLRRKHLRRAMKRHLDGQYLYTSLCVQMILKILWQDGVKRFLNNYFGKTGSTQQPDFS